jgi:hypothetical protein
MKKTLYIAILPFSLLHAVNTDQIAQALGSAASRSADLIKENQATILAMVLSTATTTAIQIYGPSANKEKVKLAKKQIEVKQNLLKCASSSNHSEYSAIKRSCPAEINDFLIHVNQYDPKKFLELASGSFNDK